MLEIQRLTRQVTSVEYGKAALPGPKYAAMKTETTTTKGMIRRGQAHPPTVTRDQMGTQRTALESAYHEYLPVHAGLLQRRMLNMPESPVRCCRATGFMLAAWANFGTKMHDPDTKVPVVFIMQFVLSAPTWLIHWHFAGPTRDARIRNEQLKVDMPTKGPQMLRGLYERRTGTPAPANITPDMITEVDDKAIDDMRSMLKDREEVQLEDVAKLYNAEAHKVVERMTELLNTGAARNRRLTVPEMKQFMADTWHKDQAEVSPVNWHCPGAWGSAGASSARPTGQPSTG